MARDIMLTSGARFYSALVGMVMLSLSARWLGPGGRGVVVVITTWVSLFATVGYLSLGQVCVYRAAKADNLDWLGPVFAALLMITAAVSMAGWLLAVTLFGVAHDQLFRGVPPAALALGFVALPFFVWEQYGSALLSIIGRVGTYNLNQIVSRTFGLILMIGAVAWLKLDITGFLIAFVVTQAMIAGAGIEILRRYARGRMSGGLKTVAGLFREGLKVHLNSIGVLLFSGVDILMLNHYRGAAQTGLFQLPMQLFIAILMVPQSALLVLNTHVATLDHSAFWMVHRRVIMLVVAALALISPLLWRLAPWFIPLLAGPGFGQSVAVFQILVLGVTGAAFNTLMGIQWIVSGYFYRASLLTLGSGMANVVLNLFLIPRYGAVGAAIATVGGLYAVPVVANIVLAISAQRGLSHPEPSHD